MENSGGSEYRMESREIDEHIPISNANKLNYHTNDFVTTNMDNEMKDQAIREPPEYIKPVPVPEQWQPCHMMIWTHLEQLKSISAGK